MTRCDECGANLEHYHHTLDCPVSLKTADWMDPDEEPDSSCWGCMGTGWEINGQPCRDCSGSGRPVPKGERAR